MKKQDIENFASQLTGKKITLHLQTKDGKWYEQEYSNDFSEIKVNTKYGVIVDSTSSIDYDFKTGKREDSILKTFVTQYISKYAIKHTFIADADNMPVNPTKEQVLKQFKSARVSKYYFYTTLYGIGIFVLFQNDGLAEQINALRSYLMQKEVKHTNEFSEARWVYRFVINKSIEEHNVLLKNFKLV